MFDIFPNQIGMRTTPRDVVSPTYSYSTRFSFDSLARAKNGQHSGTRQAKIRFIVLKCIKRYFTREFDISISLGGGSGRPTGTCI